MKWQPIIYVNREDPRIFIYKHQQWKWIGVTLNFARLASFKILVATLASAIVPLLPILCAHDRTAQSTSSIIAISASLMLFILWVSAVIWYYYRQASRDLERYPGKPSAR